MVRRCVILGVLLLGTPAFADTYCYTRGKNTYCDNGTRFHETPGGGITTSGKTGKTEKTYHKYGNHLYGSDGSWRAKKKNGNITGSLKKTPTENDRVIDDIFGGKWYDDDDD